MRANPRSGQGANASGGQPVVHELQLSVMHGRASDALSFDDGFMIGAVRTRMQARTDHFYAEQSEALIRGAPLAAAVAAVAPKPSRPQLSAKDLIAELHSINTQIHRMMFQVERAVAKLATTG